jgi:hypothetical protein
VTKKYTHDEVEQASKQTKVGKQTHIANCREYPTATVNGARQGEAGRRLSPLFVCLSDK